MTCNCIAEMDAKLREHNTKLSVTFSFPRDGSPSYTLPYIKTEKIETRKRWTNRVQFTAEIASNSEALDDMRRLAETEAKGA